MSNLIRNTIIMLLSTFFLSACSSSGSFTMKQTMVVPLQNDKTVSILVKSDKVKDQDEDTKNVAAALKERLFARLVSEGLFKSSVFYPNQAYYSLEVDITGVRIVSTAARIAFGVMAGSSSIEIEVLLRDTASNKVITTFQAVGNSAAHPFSSESGYENAIREAANNIVNALKKR